MRRFSGKTYWLVGASEGLGRALALALSKAGAEVIVSARNAERLQDLVDELPGPAQQRNRDGGIGINPAGKQPVLGQEGGEIETEQAGKGHSVPEAL